MLTQLFLVCTHDTFTAGAEAFESHGAAHFISCISADFRTQGAYAEVVAEACDALRSG